MPITSRRRILRSVIAVSVATMLCGTASRSAHAQQAAPPAPPAQQPAPPPQAAPTPPEAQPALHPHMRVDVTSTRPQTLLEERAFVDETEGTYFLVPARTRTSRWEQVCLAPCTVDLDRYAAYRIAPLGGVAGTHTFSLPQGADSTTLQVQAGDRRWHHVGGTLTGAGIAALVVGVSLVAAQHLFSDQDEARNAGFITGGAGIVVGVAGIVLSIATCTHVYSGGTKVAGEGPRHDSGTVALTPTGLVF